MNIFSRAFSGSPTARSLSSFFDAPAGWIWKMSDARRPWAAAELRIKSFDDLHSLHYKALIDLNKLASQQHEAKRFELFFPHKDQMTNIRKTMRRIKLVVWERKLAWTQARAVLKMVEQESENQTVDGTVLKVAEKTDVEGASLKIVADNADKQESTNTHKLDSTTKAQDANERQEKIKEIHLLAKSRRNLLALQKRWLAIADGRRGRKGPGLKDAKAKKSKRWSVV